MPEKLDQPDQPLPPERWSRAELTRSLENLPEGHPSFPTADVGTQSHDLRQATDGRRADSRTPQDGQPTTQDTERHADSRTPQDRQPTTQDTERHADSRTAQDRQPTTQDTERHAEGPVPSGREPTAREAESHHDDGAEGGSDRLEGTFWTQLPAFERAWAAHERRWPAETPVAADRSGDPAGSWRGDGGQYLSPDQNQRASQMIGRVHDHAEALTKQLTDVEAENTANGHLEGLKFARKGENRIKEKVAEVLKRVPDRSVTNVVRNIPDALRYTFCFDPATYAAGYNEIKDKLEARGNTMVYSKNYWSDSPEYKGINTRWDTPDGQRFEVQFHTPESFFAKHEVTHLAYERIRNPATSAAEARELHAFQRSVAAWIPVPDGAATIPDFPRKDHA